MPVSVSKTGAWWKIASVFLAIVALALEYLAHQHQTAEKARC
jgi:hypothetical protein